MLNQFCSSVEQRFWIQVLRPLFVIKESCDAIIYYFQYFALENACLRVRVGMMDDYGQCLTVIEHIVW